MKKVITVAIAVVALLSITACEPAVVYETPKPTINATAQPMTSPTAEPTKEPEPEPTKEPEPVAVKEPLTYSIVTRENYGAGPYAGTSYRLVLSRTDVTRDELMKIYNDFKGSSEVTIWCYSSVDKTNFGYDIAMIEGTGSDAEITIK